MALTDETETGVEHHSEKADAFYDRMAEKFEKEDNAARDAEDGVDAGDEDDAEEKDADDDSDDDSDSTEDDTDADTPSDEPDGDTDESDEDSTEDEETDHTDDDESEESDDETDADEGDEADADEEEAGDDEDAGDEEDEDDGASEETRAALAQRGADLKLEDVPEKYRPLITAKLKSMDAAFTRVQQEGTAFRTARHKFEADQKFREENPEHAIVELLQIAEKKDPDIFEKINTRFTKLEDADHAESFKVVLKDRRQAALAAVEAADKAEDTWRTRAQEVVTFGQKRAAEVGIPWWLAEEAIEAALLRKGAANPKVMPDLTEAEINTLLAEKAKAYSREVRGGKREKSKDKIKTRTEGRRKAPPARRAPGGSATIRPAAKKGPVVNHDDPESRQAAMLRTARRVLPGKK